MMSPAKGEKVRPGNSHVFGVYLSTKVGISTEKKAVMKLIGRKKTLSLARSVALPVRRAVACESFWVVILKYCPGHTGQH